MMLALASPESRALQLLEGGDGKTVLAQISIKDQTRISIPGARIKLVPHNAAELGVTPDEENGQIYVVPVGANPGKPITLYLTDDQHRTWHLLLQPTDIPGDTLLLHAPAVPGATGNTLESASDYERTLKNFVLAMRSGRVPTGIELREENQVIPLWAEVRMTRQAMYLGQSLVGEIYLLTNVDAKPLTLVEGELFRKGVRAVDIDNHNLAVGESTRAYIVRERRSNDE